MDIMLFDVLRVAIFAFFGIGLGFNIVTNYLAFQVLRPPKKIGFLWWHVTAISLSFIFISVAAIDRVIGQVGKPSTWISYLTVVGFLLYAVAQILIFQVERARFLQVQAQRVAIKVGQSE